ncbi:DUF4823 domain-containing protein [Vibrio mangrovi]|uniref:DUF4823 domain-containing protein n=1 Tax=Vibrio mangrovi TaxID=474394 RepID=A0A1Y6IY84_9VIBR|nr:DUF4823 domain-containing protein [Vibrio mangrovi]MDW6005204.1 DUF4823 domain-containing protein [Vibrio mangrovi]SMS02586.1 hypothetical protein VIM7927_03919 [Vibrio mangrovi]
MIKKIKIIFISMSTLFVFACSSNSYNIDTINGKVLDNSSKIPLQSVSIYLVNGGSGMKMTYLSPINSDEVAEGSDISALRIANDELSKYTSRVTTDRNVLTEDKALEIGTINKNDYLIYSRVEKWSDPLGINCNEYYYDEASVLISMYSLKDKKLINTSRLSSASCPSKVNGIPLSTGSPEKLYEILFSKWLNENFSIKK